MLEKLLAEYKEKFGEPFPMFVVRYLDDEEISKSIQECIDKGEPLELEDGADY